jgi:hypothetical protein
MATTVAPQTIGKLVGQRIRRREDPRLITGTATYVDDIQKPGMHHACIVRSPYAAAKIRRIDATAALALPGVAAGTYELRLFANNTFTRLAVSNGFTVAAGPTLSASPTTVSQGSSVTATWAGISAPTATDWVAIVPVNSPDSSSVAFAYSNGVAAGSVSIYIPISVAAGTYELRFYSGNTQAQLAVSNSFTVTATVVASSAQAADTKCGNLTLTNAGVKGITGTGTLPDCW